MNNYQFRTNWRGKLILQRRYTASDRWGDRYQFWRDATTTDLKDYYEQLYKVQALCARQ